MKRIFLDTNVIENALQQPSADIEDMLQYQCARKHQCDAILTRNCKHFIFSKIPVMTPAAYLKE